MGSAGASGGTVTVLVNIDDDTTATNAILDASALDGHANGANCTSLDFGGV